jgi:hypothetical protein
VAGELAGVDVVDLASRPARAGGLEDLHRRGAGKVVCRAGDQAWAVIVAMASSAG